MENRKENFDNLRKEWNHLQAKTNDEIQSILIEKENHSIDLHDLTLKMKGWYEDYDVVAETIFIDPNGDIMIVDDNNNYYALDELCLGQSLGLLWELI